MATKKNTTVATVAETNGKSKAQVIRDYAKAHPDAKPSEIAKALTKAGTEVGPGRVSGVLRQGTGGTKIDVESIKTAATFAKEFDSLDEALAAIDAVGKYIDACGSSAKAKAALESYQALRAAM